MIPTIGMIIGIYVILRCVDLIAAAPTRYGSVKSQRTVKVMAFLTFSITLILMFGLMLSGSSSPAIR